VKIVYYLVVLISVHCFFKLQLSAEVLFCACMPVSWIHYSLQWYFVLAAL